MIINTEGQGVYTLKIIVVDVQKGITDERLYNFKGFIENVSRIIDTARRNNVEVIYVQHDDGPGTGFSIGDKDFEIADQFAPMAGEKIFIKEINSFFGNKRGYRVVIPEGTNSTFDNDYMDGETTYRYYNEMMWPERFAQCVSVEEAIAMMEK